MLVVGFVYTNHPTWFSERLRIDPDQLGAWPAIVIGYVGGFALGYLMRLLPLRHFWGFQAFQAWLAMIAMTLLFIEIIIQAFINPSLKERFDLPIWEAIVTGVTAYYFGVRS